MIGDHPVFAPGQPRRGVAVASMFLAAALFAAMALCAKAARSGTGEPLPASQLVLFRFAFGVLAVLPLHGRRGINLWGQDRRGLVMRGVYGGFAVYAYFLSLQLTSLTHAVLLNYTSLIFAPVFAALMLAERITGRTAAAVFVAVVGIALVVKPDGGGSLVGDVSGLFSGLMAGAAITEVRLLRRTESAWSVFFYFSLIGLPIGLAACVAQPPAWPSVSGWWLMSAMGACSVAAQMLMTFGYRYVRAAEGSLMTLTQVVYSGLAGAWIFHEPLGVRTLAGGALILAPALWLSVRRQDGGRSGE